MKWFKHDSNAHTDDKIQKVLMRYGAEGYALYWYCIELIAARVTPDNITFELKHDAEILGYHLKIDTLRVEEIIKYMVGLELFNMSNDKIVCLKLASRLDNTLTQNPQIKETLSNFNKLKVDKNRLDKKRKEKNKTIVADAPKFNFKDEVLALGVWNETLEDWLIVRKKKKASNTLTAFKTLVTEITASGLHPQQAIEMAAANSWAGFKAEWANKPSQASSKPESLDFNSTGWSQ